MRTRDQIIDLIEAKANPGMIYNQLIIELLMDIRDLLAKETERK